VELLVVREVVVRVEQLEGGVEEVAVAVVEVDAEEAAAVEAGAVVEGGERTM
jgi:hypothetical protein